MHEIDSKAAIAKGNEHVTPETVLTNAGEGLLYKAELEQCHHSTEHTQIPKQIIKVYFTPQLFAGDCNYKWS